MKIRVNWQTVGLVPVVLALAASFLSAKPQKHLALIHDAEGRAVYVNAVEADRSVRNPAGFASSVPEPDSGVHGLITRTAQSLEVDPGLVEAVVKVESGYHARARSPKGAMGLMQLMPATAARFGVLDPFDSAENVRGGVAYLGHLLKQFNGDVTLSLAAYNAGEGAVLRHGGIPRFEETQEYIRKVLALYPLVAVRTTNSGPELTSTLVNEVRNRASAPDNAAGSAPIYRYVDSEGVVHFSQ